MTERLIPPLNLFSTPTGSICVVFEPPFSFNLATSEYPLLGVKGKTCHWEKTPRKWNLYELVNHFLE